jgi:FKBP-type peptidyl-prolyl cis-trans isomerase FklB
VFLQEHFVTFARRASPVCPSLTRDATIVAMLKSFMIAPRLLAASVLLGSAFAQPASPQQGSSSTPAAGQTSSQTTPKTSSGTASNTAKKPAARPGASAPVVLKTDRDKQSYAMGMNLGNRLKQPGIKLDPAMVARGLRDAQSGVKTAMTEDEARNALQQLQTEAQKTMQAKSQQEGAGNRKEGDAFLAANKSKSGVVTLPDGMQYKILTEGKGPKPTASDTVSCNYRGTLINGKEFDSSSKHGGPASFAVGGVIKGWTEALQLMPVGSKWELYIPPDLAYGDRGAGGDIGPGETLVFEVELLSIQEQKK